MIPTEDEIRKRAREIWEQEGQPDGRELEHWQQAETELKESSLSNPSTANPASGKSTSGSVASDKDRLKSETKMAREKQS